MVRLAVSVEGLTEERFVELVLYDHLLGLGIHVTPISIGGNVSIPRICHNIEKLIHGFDFVTTFYDFYGFKNKDQGETKHGLEAKIRNALPERLRGKFFPYIQMYEFEGLLFSCPAIMSTILQDEEVEAWAGGVLRQFGGNPEDINDSPQTAPSKRLERQTSYRKTTHGPDITKQIGLDKIRSTCSGFNDWLSKIECLNDNNGNR
ncbi:DUF4276 family protein [Eilatimonas milleporae]|uniref:Uncharacterized protein DUF4276 n=1 Tax=Eilatimonas milleporae TaxID=911205 RepID=A0A3M0CWK1_9PROT|nr:DUF4276 family protein [Eilatimonas milleporae]RMB08193.1 uncharacterized protein DUF4276 [Eilatimonas milleporae]